MKTLKEFQAHYIEREIERVKRLNNVNSREKLLQFREELVISGLSEERQYFIIQKLRTLENEVGIIPLDASKVRTAMIWIMGKKFEKWTIIGYQTALVKFWKSELSGAPSPMPPYVSDILRLKRDKKHKLKANDLISQEDLDRILDNCLNSRDKALFSFLYDGGLRHNEVLNLKNRDLTFDQYGAKVIVPEEGKTGTRMVRITYKDRSLPFLRQWQKDHPRANDGEAYLFCKIELRTRGEQIGYQDLNRILNDVLKRGKIQKRIYPHLFRHTRATILASRLAQRPLEMQMGWVPGTSMLGTYAHLDESAQDEAVLSLYGITKDESEPLDINSPKKCPICGNENDYRARFCNTCGFVLDRNQAESKIAEEAQKIEDSILGSESLDPQVKAIVKSASPEQKEAALELVLSMIKDSPELLGNFRRIKPGKS